MRPALRAQLAALGAWADRLEGSEFRIGTWEGGEADANGVISMPWFRLSDDAEAFTSDVAGHGWIQVFDWMRWLQTPEARRLLDEPGVLEAAGPEDLRRLLTSIIRSERFGDGNIAGAHESGLLARICRRAEVLANAE